MNASRSSPERVTRTPGVETERTERDSPLAPPLAEFAAELASRRGVSRDLFLMWRLFRISPVRRHPENADQHQERRDGREHGVPDKAVSVDVPRPESEADHEEKCPRHTAPRNRLLRRLLQIHPCQPCHVDRDTSLQPLDGLPLAFDGVG